MPTLSETNYRNYSPSDIKTRLDQLKAQTTYDLIDTTEIKVAIQELQKRVNTNPATELQISSESLLSIKQKIAEAQEDLKIAEERVKTMRNVDKQASYYESWFPINRPLRSSSIIICFGFGIFFFSLSFFLFLRYLGIRINMNILWITPENMVIYQKLIPYGAGVIILGILILAIVGWVRKS